MEDYKEAMAKALTAVAWADGRVEAEEHEVIDALLDALEIRGEDADSIRTWAQSPRTLDDVPITDLSASDRRTVLQQAVILTYIDGHQSEKEKELLHDLVKRLRVPEEEARDLLADAERRAQSLLKFLQA